MWRRAAAGTRAREARRAAAAIWVACATDDSNQPAAAAPQAAGGGVWDEELEAPRPARRALAPLLAICLVVDVCAQILSAGPEFCAARKSANSQLAQLFYDLKEVRDQCSLGQIASGALPLPRALALACVLRRVRVVPLARNSRAG